MRNKVLFVFEGNKTERQIANSISKCFPDKAFDVCCTYCTTIYNLYNTIKDDEDLDTFSLLKEMPHNRKVLEPYTRNSFAEIYLFFDYDGHDTLADDDKMSDILDLFNEETEHGRIFINYPMVESLKHISDEIDFKYLKVKAKKNIKYKKVVSEDGDEKYCYYSKYTSEIWRFLIDEHLKKMNYITNGDYSMPEECISQDIIFNNQRQKYIDVDSTVAVLNSFPIFLFDYYGYETTEKLIHKSKY